LGELQHQRILKVLPLFTQIFKYYEETFSGCRGEKRYEIGLLLERGLGSL
jgi:hypothetical protein